jgi:23S rRNA-/tRNA-specific pseudouridylate synthase
VAESEPGDKGVLAQSGHGPVRVLLRQGGALILDKPPGLATTGRNLDDPDCLQHVVGEALGRRVWAPHQLDAGTSGVVVFVERRALVERWQKRLRAPSTHKDYLAVVHGAPDFDKTLVEAPVAGKPSRTLVRVLDRAAKSALVEARLLTGRTHQVRVHLAHAGHPLLGERRYREPPSEGFGRPALHAWRLRWNDDEGAEQRVTAPLPDDLTALLDGLGLRLPT